MNLNEMLKQLPRKPGVYRMLDALGNIIYVGKAKDLKNRVSQYFRKQKDRAPKVEEMIHNIHTFNYQVTDTELDAFIEECRLIKEIKPRYNKQMKNTKYLYLKIPNEQFPKLTIVKEKTDDGAVYFGPFTSRHRVESAVQFLNDFYPIRKCTSPGFVTRASGCLFRQLGTCLGVCTGQVSPAEYKLHLDKVQLLLSGNDKSVVRELLTRIDSASADLKFEQAAQYREYYLGLRHVIGKQQLVQTSSKNRNVLAVEFIDTNTAKLFYIKGNKLLHSELINLLTNDTVGLKIRLKEGIRDRFRMAKSNLGGLTQYDIDEAQIIYSYLKRNKQRIHSFWIPANRLDSETSLETTVGEIIDRITDGVLRKNPA